LRYRIAHREDHKYAWLGVVAFAIVIAGLGLSPRTAWAAPAPVHPFLESSSLNGAATPGGEFEKACGLTVDSAGDVYVANSGKGEIAVFGPSGTYLTSIADPNEPCGLAVDSAGNLYALDTASKGVVRFSPEGANFPPTSGQSYASAAVVDATGLVTGIAVNPANSHLFLDEGSAIIERGSAAEGSPIINEHIGEGKLSEGVGVGVWGATGEIYAASEAGVVYVFDSTGTKVRAEINGAGRPGGGYGAAPGSLPEVQIAVDQKNGHVLVSDIAVAGTVDEFESTGQFVSQITHSFVDAEPSAVAVDSSEGPRTGRVYVSSRAGTSDAVDAFGPLPAPTYRELPNLKLPEGALGPEKPSLKSSRGLAFDSEGDLYVVSEGAAGIQIFVPEAGGFRYVAKLSDNRSPKSIAVDSRGNVYVGQATVANGSQQAVVEYPTTSAYPFADASPTYGPPVEVDSFRVGEGEGAEIAINPENDHLFVGHYGEVREFDSATSSAPNPPVLLHAGVASNLAQIEGIGVYGKTGVLYVFEHSFSRVVGIIPATGEQITSFNLNGVPGGQPFPFNGNIAVDQSNGHIYVTGDIGGPIYEYEASGAFVGSIPLSSGSGPSSVHLAVDNAAGANDRDIFVSGGVNGPATVRAFAPAQYGQPPVAVSGPVEDADGAAGRVTLTGTVNPNAALVESCHFQYVTRAAFEASGFADLSSGGEAECEPPAASIGSGEVPVAVRAQVSGLSASSAYEYRLVSATSFGQGEGGDRGFGPPAVEAEGVVEALHTEAIVSATVDTASISTNYRCEYGPTAGYGHTTADVEVEGLTRALVRCSFFGLDPGVTYHYRVVATNPWTSIAGEDQTFETETEPVAQICPNAVFRTGPSARLPDCRAYELVSPPLGTLVPTDALVPAAGAFPGALASAGGEGLLFFGEANPPGFPGNGSNNAYRSRRTGAGWITSLAGPGSAEMPLSNPGGVSADQDYSFWSTGGGGALSEGNYLRLPGGGFQPIGLGEGGTADPTARGVFISAGGGHVLFTSPVPLAEGAPVAGKMGIYDRPADGTARLVSIPPPEASSIVAAEFEEDGAVYQGSSADGATVSFSVGPTLYIHREGRTSSVATGTFTAATGLKNLAFGGLSTNGSHLFYLDVPRAIGYVGVQRGEILVYDVYTGTSTPVGSGGESVMVNVSPDGSHVYFASRTVLNPGETNAEGDEAAAGSENLYAWSASAAPSFIATVADADVEYEGPGGFRGAQRLGYWTQGAGPETTQVRGPAMDPSRTSANGAAFAFESVASLTSYDSRGHPEVYLYEPGDGIRCVSCNVGSVPTSGAVLQLISQPSENQEGVLGPSSGYTIMANLTSDGSMVFFETEEGLVPQDRNGAGDVYEWHEGTISLISSARGTGASYLVGASEDGRNVFFTTGDSLVPDDSDGGVLSIYDARVDGGFAATTPQASCRGEECRGASLSPAPGLPSPGSTSLSGAGNVGAVHKCPRGKQSVKKAGANRCVTKKKKRHKKKHKPGNGKKAASARHGRGK
jgi:hypothetical protein